MNLGPYIIAYSIALGVIVIGGFLSQICTDISDAHYEGMPAPQPRFSSELVFATLASFVLVGGFLHILSAIDRALQNNLPVTW